MVCCEVACASNPPPLPSSSKSHPSAGSAALWPQPAAEADTSSAVVLLASPRPQRAARLIVRGFFQAVQHESVPDLTALLSDGATISSGPGSSPEPVPKVWAGRFKRLDYRADGAKIPYRDDQLGVFTPDELAHLGEARRYELNPAPGEILAVVTPRERSGAAGPRHFGRRIEFILGQTEDGLRILRIFEDFRLP
ncbi:MAG: hypothetical protein ABI895_08385 [Deltaproteobacteria bacterium]